jgi:hypothetical protein
MPRSSIDSTGARGVGWLERVLSASMTDPDTSRIQLERNLSGKMSEANALDAT